MAIVVAGIGTAKWKSVNHSNELRPGDLVEFPRKLFYSHWGVYVGKNTIVHLSGYEDEKGGVSGVGYQQILVGFLYGKTTAKARVCAEDFLKVAGDSIARINNSRDEEWPSLPPEEIVERAWSRVGEEGDYNFVDENCEHFATWCRYGVERSKQIDNAKARAATAAEIGKAGATAAVEIGKAGAIFAVRAGAAGVNFVFSFFNALDEHEGNRKPKITYKNPL